MPEKIITTTSADDSVSQDMHTRIDDIVFGVSRGDDGVTIESVDHAWFDALSPEQKSVVGENIRLLSHLNGHKGADLRHLVAEGESAEAVFMRGLLEWSSTLGTGSGVDTEVPAQMTPESLKGVSAVALYERLSFLDKNPNTTQETYLVDLQQECARILDVQSNKWIDLIDPLFNNPTVIEDLICELGFVPEEIFTKKKFKSVEPQKIIQCINTLRTLEGGELIHEARRERARIINHLFMSRRAEPLRVKDRAHILLDSNGISITFSGFYSHLPYGLIDDATITEFERGNWLDADSVTELKVQRAKTNNERGTVGVIQQNQDGQFLTRVGCAENTFFEYVKKTGPASVARSVVENGWILPDGIIEQAQSKEECVLIMQLAEEMTSLISGYIYTKESVELSGYSANRVATDSYEVESKILNSPNYYNIVKLVHHFLSHTGQTSEADRYAVFRGQYKKSKEGDQHSFVGVMHDAVLARVLINEKKHIPPHVRGVFERMPMFDRASYDGLESALRIFHSFSNSLESLRKDMYVSDSIENCLHFVLNNVSEKYAVANSLYDKVRQSPSDSDSTNALIALFEQAKEEYSTFLYKNILSQRHFEEKFSPEVQTTDVVFDDAFIVGARKICPTGFDEAVSNQGVTARMVSLEYRLNDPSQTIPFHIEESCLDALRIDRDRPLINIIGGCKHLDGVVNPLQIFGDTVGRVAHAHKANVGVPGTQSGIGTVFGQLNIEYGRQYGHLAHADRAHFFAINPGGSVYFPGNRFVAEGDGSVYANTPVDTLVTPIPAEWNKRGLDKYTSKYITHIAYMEALYHRMSVGQKQVLVVGNGGLYSIMEINEALKRNAGLVLVSDTGRFAEVASALVPHIDSILSATSPDKAILEILKSQMGVETLQEFLKKDFGSQELAENDDYKVYRDFFITFLKLAKEKMSHIIATDLQGLEQTLETTLSQGR
ncbi:MAG: hypothetical protein RLZZ347_200 [Candidatus Parcubacteria bacterium]|jgi:hypothetical protein